MRATCRLLPLSLGLVLVTLPAGLGELSMGMTGDLEVAIAEGSTCVRVGRALYAGLSGF